MGEKRRKRSHSLCNGRHRPSEAIDLSPSTIKLQIESVRKSVKRNQGKEKIRFNETAKNSANPPLSHQH